MPLLATEVFTPNDYPKYTYVERGGQKLEQLLADALQTPKAVVSISGPSKSGKTVLVERIVGNDNIIVVSGAEIRTAEGLWDRALDWMGAPSSVTEQETKGTADQYGGQFSGGVGVPLVARADAQANMATTDTRSNSTATVRGRGGLAQVAKEIADSEFVLLVDDFHYMDREIQAEAAKQIKAAAERGIKICVASVPHRSDDVVRSNPELRGRTSNIDTTFWTPAELKEIAIRGFARLNAEIADEDALRFANESCGSPQLMQAICLQACRLLNLREESPKLIKLVVPATVARTIFEVTSLQSDYSSLVGRMHQGPKIRGVERKTFKLHDGSMGDVYRCVLLAIAEDPPRMGLPYQELMARIERVCTADSPVGSSVKEACKQIRDFALAMYPNQRIIDFDDEAATDTLSIVDPYFLFYLRSSTKLEALGKN